MKTRSARAPPVPANVSALTTVTSTRRRVATRPPKPLPARDLTGVAQPDARIAPDAEDGATAEPPGAIGGALRVDEQRVGQLQPTQEGPPEQLRAVEGDEHRGAECIDPATLVEHLHEVRAADQSTGMPEEDEQHRLPAQVLEPEEIAAQIRQRERTRALTNSKGRAGSHPISSPHVYLPLTGRGCGPAARDDPQIRDDEGNAEIEDDLRTGASCRMTSDQDVALVDQGEDATHGQGDRERTP